MVVLGFVWPLESGGDAGPVTWTPAASDGLCWKWGLSWFCNGVHHFTSKIALHPALLPEPWCEQGPVLHGEIRKIPIKRVSPRNNIVARWSYKSLDRWGPITGTSLRSWKWRLRVNAFGFSVLPMDYIWEEHDGRIPSDKPCGVLKTTERYMSIECHWLISVNEALYISLQQVPTYVSIPAPHKWPHTTGSVRIVHKNESGHLAAMATAPFLPMFPNLFFFIRFAHLYRLGLAPFITRPGKQQDCAS